MNEKLEIRNKFLDAFEGRIIKLSKFLNSRELICVLFCYIKTGKGSDLLFRSLEERVLLTIDEMTI